MSIFLSAQKMNLSLEYGVEVPKSLSRRVFHSIENVFSIDVMAETSPFNRSVTRMIKERFSDTCRTNVFL